MTRFRIKRIYDPAEKSDGLRILVDRLWPRGLKKEDAQIDLWFKEAAPSVDLRKWFDHDPDKWQEFKKRYIIELEGNKAIANLLDRVKMSKTVTLLYAARDKEHNHSLVLQGFLEENAAAEP
ncbi:MAG TPA: DUF488 domain-containing protein [Daejeonella sp.]|uniref:DUF488 domain-containing protein n=1 Tax=Daejeonella sp. TaxID=2805397 RepID=UPI002EDB40B8